MSENTLIQLIMAQRAREHAERQCSPTSRKVTDWLLSAAIDGLAVIITLFFIFIVAALSLAARALHAFHRVIEQPI
jgi:hypothetical protein